MLQKIKKLIPQILVSQYHHFLAWFGAFIYGWPSNKLVVIGVTGTSGKSTSVLLIAKILEEAGFKVGYTSTIGFKIDQEEWLNEHKVTMLGWLFNQRLLKRMVKAGCQYAIIESSSQGALQYRHIGINYDLMLFTNLHPEHIEAHGGFENYKKAKGKLFEHLTKYKRKKIDRVETHRREDSEWVEQNTMQENQNTTDKGNGASYSFENSGMSYNAIGASNSNLQNHVPKQIIVNLDDEHAEYFAGFPADEKYGFTITNNQTSNTKKISIINHQNILEVRDIKFSENGSSFLIHNSKFIIHLFGEYNIYNSLAAITVCNALGLDLETCAKGLSKVKSIPGHMEEIKNDRGFRIFVDYAFEPEALQKSYEIIKNIIKPKGKILHVLGSAGGGRDTARRPVLGALAAQNADIIIVTNEDPYDEDPGEIIDAVIRGIDENIQSPIPNHQKIINNQCSIYKILDRREAIHRALELAQPNDLVFITGKGCEQFICVAGGKKIKWDDRAVVKAELRSLN